MENSNRIEQGFIIDRLTNSILNTVSGDSFQTEVIQLGKSDLKYITKNKGWHFMLVKFHSKKGLKVMLHLLPKPD